jgi:hypothetical protein
MGGQPGKPKPPGNPPAYPYHDDGEDDDDRVPIEAPPMPIPVSADRTPARAVAMSGVAANPIAKGR